MLIEVKFDHPPCRTPVYICQHTFICAYNSSCSDLCIWFSLI